MLAATRPDSWDFPLFLHVFGAMALVGTLIAVLAALVVAWRDSAAAITLRRFAFRTLVLGTIPAYIVMRVAAQLILSKEEDLNDKIDDQTWVGIGFAVAEPGLLLLIAACIVAWLASRKAPQGGGRGLARAATILTAIVLVAVVVAMWAMTAKPGA